MPAARSMFHVCRSMRPKSVVGEKWRVASQWGREIIIRLSILIWFFVWISEHINHLCGLSYERARTERNYITATFSPPPVVCGWNTYTILARTNLKIDNLRFRSASSGVNVSVGRNDHLSNAAEYYSTMVNSGDKLAIIRWPFWVHAMAAVHLIETNETRRRQKKNGFNFVQHTQKHEVDEPEKKQLKNIKHKSLTQLSERTYGNGVN